MPCSFSTTTSSGTFTITNKEMTRCEAKKYCRERNQILAPITTQEDKDAILNLIDPSCQIHKGDKFYHIGLEVTPCGKTQERIFSNGIVYDKDIHGKLYDDLSKPEDKCPDAYLMYYDDNPFTIGTLPNCYQQYQRVICLDETTATASPFSQEKTSLVHNNSTQVFLTVGRMFCAIIGIIGFATAQIYKRKVNWKRKFDF